MVTKRMSFHVQLLDKVLSCDSLMERERGEAACGDGLGGGKVVCGTACGFV